MHPQSFPEKLMGSRETNVVAKPTRAVLRGGLSLCLRYANTPTPKMTAGLQGSPQSEGGESGDRERRDERIEGERRGERGMAVSIREAP